MWLLSLLLALVCVVDTTDDRRELLARAVAQYAEPLGARIDARTLDVAWADLNGDGLDDGLVRLSLRGGGWTVLVFEAMPPEDAVEVGPFLPAAEIRAVYGPLVIVPRANGWCDIVATAARGTYRRLRFDGETYPPRTSLGTLVRQLPTGQVVFRTR
ncbi:hypothetical protein [Rubrivirga sp. IMCC45206]|uniref:hypothetical protein n=1 Tax=Rubrivirga sp. IMCC45206 TaxID=3391614 RepID=UPI0039902D51